jgi:hypothetical protein
MLRLQFCHLLRVGLFIGLASLKNGHTFIKLICHVLLVFVCGVLLLHFPEEQCFIVSTNFAISQANQ